MVKGVVDLTTAGDATLRELVLGNWHKLNSCLVNNPDATTIARLLRLELATKKPRSNIVIRLRRALNRANGNEANAALAQWLRGKRSPEIYQKATT